MKMYSFKNGAEALPELCTELYRHGTIVHPRGQKTFELRNVLIEIIDPSDVLMFGINRTGWNIRIALAEALQLIGGFSDPSAMVRIAPAFKNFINPETQQFDGAYGPRVSEQLDAVVKTLTDDPASRQAVVQIWKPEDLIAQSLDKPCTVYMNFHIRNAGLHMTTHMRSNDVWWGFCYDLFQFTQLGWTIARCLNTTLDSYTHIADSFHLYARDLSAAAQTTMRDQRHAMQTFNGLHMPDGMAVTMENFQTVAKEIFYSDNGMCLGNAEWAGFDLVGLFHD